ncbi:TPA: hypothetical protein HA241_04575 [Candidatus Woesearchaeota archaeon]|nr:hypothetical protein [Candidatus Woesearchaeota archaeon]
MKKRELIVGILFLILISGCTNQLELKDINERENSPINIPIYKDKQTNEENISIALSHYGKSFAKENVSLTVRFNNLGKEIKILNLFEPIPVFFSFHIKREDGTPIIVPLGGKIDLINDQINCITLEGPGDQYYADLNLNEILPEGLDVGTYNVSVEYHNQYGDCFKGVLVSDIITIKVVEKTPEEIIFEETYRNYIDNPKYCERDTDCICLMGSGMPFVGCGNFLQSGPGGSYECTRCQCLNGICQE